MLRTSVPSLAAINSVPCSSRKTSAGAAAAPPPRGRRALYPPLEIRAAPSSPSRKRGRAGPGERTLPPQAHAKIALLRAHAASRAPLRRAMAHASLPCAPAASRPLLASPGPSTASCCYLSATPLSLGGGGKGPRRALAAAPAPGGCQDSRWRAGVSSFSFLPPFLKGKGESDAKKAEKLKEELLAAIAPLDRGAEATPEEKEGVEQVSMRKQRFVSFTDRCPCANASILAFASDCSATGGGEPGEGAAQVRSPQREVGALVHHLHIHIAATGFFPRPCLGMTVLNFFVSPTVL